MSSPAPDRTVDLRTSKCPANCVEAIQVLEQADEGTVTEFWIASDTVLDIPRIMRESGHTVLSVWEADATTRAILVARRPEVTARPAQPTQTTTKGAATC